MNFSFTSNSYDRVVNDQMFCDRRFTNLFIRPRFVLPQELYVKTRLKIQYLFNLYTMSHLHEFCDFFMSSSHFTKRIKYFTFKTINLHNKLNRINLIT